MPPTIPRDSSPDGTLALLGDPYRFISTRCAPLRSDVFETRLMLRRAVCVMGEEAAHVFCHPGRFTPRGALPITALVLLQDRGSAAVLDGAAHRHRKAMLMSLVTPARLAALDDAVVELLDILRPTVAVERFVTFVALALHEHPECRERSRGVDGEPYLEWFVQEVRRFYPFFPMVGGRALTAFEWRGHRFAEGTWMLLDLYGTDHDARSWDEPEAFRPERFARWDGSAFDLVPRGEAITSPAIGAPASGRRSGS